MWRITERETAILLDQKRVSIREVTRFDLGGQPLERIGVEAGCRGVSDDPVDRFFRSVRSLIGLRAGDAQEQPERVHACQVSHHPPP
jgi:hypothetical protein